MSQEEILNYLEENKGKWLRAKEIIVALKMQYTRGIVNLKRLRKSNQVDFIMGTMKTERHGIRPVHLYRYKNEQTN